MPARDRPSSPGVSVLFFVLSLFVFCPRVSPSVILATYCKSSSQVSETGASDCVHPASCIELSSYGIDASYNTGVTAERTICGAFGHQHESFSEAVPRRSCFVARLKERQTTTLCALNSPFVRQPLGSRHGHLHVVIVAIVC